MSEQQPAKKEEEAGPPAGKPKKEKKKPEGLVIPPPKPKLTKAERRALQEQQRAAKAARQQQQKQGGGGGGGESSKQQQKQQHHHQGGKHQASSAEGSKKGQHGGAVASAQASPTSRGTGLATETNAISMVSHLPPYQDPDSLFNAGATLTHLPPTATTGSASSTSSPHHNFQDLHPAVLETGYQYATGQIRGGNARCRAMLQCYRQVLHDFVPSEAAAAASTTNKQTQQQQKNNKKGDDLRHLVDSRVLKPAFHYWTEHCRPHSVSMGNAFTFLKTAVASLDRDLQDDYASIQAILDETITAYEQERIDFADQAISELACQKLIKDEKEVLLIYGYSEVITALLLKAVECKKQFRVILVDSRPLLEGRKQLEHIRDAGIECSYILLNALTYVLQDVTKVLLGAAALMSDGSVMGRVGTASVAMAAHENKIPVLICSETYKISHRVQLESITSNELGDPNALALGSESLRDWKDKEHLKLLNLLYDMTPAAFVSGIVTELGILPPSSVAVLLRELNPQDLKST